MAPMVAKNGGKICDNGDNDDRLEKICQYVLQISHAPLHKSMTLLESLVPRASLTPMASMTPMNQHSHQRITNVVNGAIDTIEVNDTNGTNESLFAPMDRQCFYWRH